MQTYKIIVLIILLGFISTISNGCGDGAAADNHSARVDRNKASSKMVAVKEGPILSVNNVQSDPYAYLGTITITGVVAGINPRDSKLFAMIETSEAKICKITGCARFYLSVKYEGLTPKTWDEVNVTGSFVDVDGKFFFKAAKIKVISHLKV